MTHPAEKMSMEGVMAIFDSSTVYGGVSQRSGAK